MLSRKPLTAAAIAGAIQVLTDLGTKMSIDKSSGELHGAADWTRSSNITLATSALALGAGAAMGGLHDAKGYGRGVVWVGASGIAFALLLRLAAPHLPSRN